MFDYVQVAEMEGTGRERKSSLGSDTLDAGPSF